MLHFFPTIYAGIFSNSPRRLFAIIYIYIYIYIHQEVFVACVYFRDRGEHPSKMAKRFQVRESLLSSQISSRPISLISGSV